MTDHNPSLHRPDGGASDDDSERLNAHMQELAEKQFSRDMRQAAQILSRGNGHDAIPLLERCYGQRPHDVNVLTNLGGAYILAGKHKHAVPVLEHATELVSDNPAIWTNLAAAYLGKLVTASKDQRKRALAAYQRVLELDPAYPNVHYNMGLIYIDQRSWEQAEAAFTDALRVNPHDKDAHMMRQRVTEILEEQFNDGEPTAD
jgi:tetratricopeptide (TPR) repeat protein